MHLWLLYVIIRHPRSAWEHGARVKSDTRVNGWRFAYALPPCAPMSTNSPKTTQNQPQPVTPYPGVQAKVYISVVKGRNIRPSNGMTNESNARVTSGVNSHRNNSASRGEASTGGERK